MKEKVKAFFNSLSQDEFREFWRFLRTRQWQEWINTRMNGRKIE